MYKSGQIIPGASEVYDRHVTDEGLQHLTGLRTLEWLELSGTQLTEQGIEELRKALPNCRIDWSRPTTNKAKDQP